MSSDSHAAHGLAKPADSAENTTETTGASRWLVVVVALCGALAGGSIVEAIAALAAHTSTPVSPGHLIAEPLVVAGAICGGLLAAVLTGKEQRVTQGNGPAAERIIQADITPSEPIMWQPVPPVIPMAQSMAGTEPPPTRTSRRSLRHRRALPGRATQHYVTRAMASRSSVER